MWCFTLEGVLKIEETLLMWNSEVFVPEVELVNCWFLIWNQWTVGFNKISELLKPVNFGFCEIGELLKPVDCWFYEISELLEPVNCWFLRN